MERNFEAQEFADRENSGCHRQPEVLVPMDRQRKANGGLQQISAAENIVDPVNTLSGIQINLEMDRT